MKPIEVECPFCGAKPGQKCTEPYIGEYQYTFHNMRILAAKKAQAA